MKAKTITKSKTAAAVASRAKKPAVTTRASASSPSKPRAVLRAAAAARRKKPALVRAGSAKGSTARNQAGSAKPAVASKLVQAKPAAAKKKTTAAVNVSKGQTGKPAAVRKAEESGIRAAQKPASSSDTVAALLAFKRNAARLTEARNRAATIKPPVNSSTLSLESNDRMTVSKEAGKKQSMRNASAPTGTNATRPDAKTAAAALDIKTVDTKSLDTRSTVKGLVSKVPASISDRPAGLAPVAASASLLNAAEARPAEKPGVVAAPKPAKAGGAHRPLFKPGEFVVYPSHGVGQIVVIEEQEVAGFALELYVISFIKDKMILKVPTPKAASVGMRKLADAAAVKAALDILAGRARVKRTMWSRRAQEYEAKINSGDLNAIAEVVRDLYRSDTQPEQSYSERQLYEAALDRLAREVIVVQKMTETESLNVIEAQLQKGPRRGKAEEIDAEADAEEAEIEEAA